MVGGAHGQAGRHVLKHVVMVTEADKDPVTIPCLQGVEVIVLVTTPRAKLVTLQLVQVHKILCIEIAIS